MKHFKSAVILRKLILRNKAKLGLLGLAIGMTSFQSITHSSPNFEELDLSSVAKGTSIQRSTELGKITPTEIKGQKEVMVLLKDPAMSKAWGLSTTEAQRAWRVTMGSRDITVAIIDTGIDVRHPDLVNNLWVNPGETGVDSKGRNKASNGVDDDGNGYIDDVNGWNFVDNNNNLTDNHGHGSHIAGIIGAEGGNGIGASGIAPKVSLMALKYYDPKASGGNNLLNTIRAIQYAVKMKAQIINYSGGGLDPSPEEKRAIEMANQANILFVAAAGNERSNSDVKGYYPADYNLPNIISVTAIDQFKSVLPTSNWGERSVDIAAPGHNIYSTLPGGKYGMHTGTSQATAFVSGVAALVMANNPELRRADRIVKYLTQTGDTDTRLAGKTRYQKILNSYKALAIQDRDLSINGVRAENITHLDGAFTAQGAGNLAMVPSEVAPEPSRDLAQFGLALQKALGKKQRKQGAEPGVLGGFGPTSSNAE